MHMYKFIVYYNLNLLTVKMTYVMHMLHESITNLTKPIKRYQVKT